MNGETSVPLIVGAAGVGILLLAFVLNLLQKVSDRSVVYLLMNLVGSLMAAWYAWVSEIIPFVVLEVAWAGAALVRLSTGSRKRPPLRREP